MNLRREIANLLWPNRTCPICGAPLADELLCRACRETLNGLQNCPHCAAFIPRANFAAHTCQRCPEVSAMLACFPYTAELRERLRLLKYYQKAQIAATFGNLLAARWHDFAAADPQADADAIVPVPLHPARFAERGYNQSELLAVTLSRELQIPVYAHAVKRTKNTKAQHSLTPRERTENLQGAFAAGHDLPKVNGKRIILLDDIITTGATIRGCAEVLLAGGAAAVYALAVAGHLNK